MLETLADRFLKVVRIRTTLAIRRNLEEPDASLANIQRRWPRRPIDLLGGLVRDEVMLLTHLAVGEPDEEEDTDRLGVDLILSQHPLSERIPSRRKRGMEATRHSIERVLAILQDFASPSHFHCRFSWTYSQDEVTPIIQLPILRMDIPGTPFRQISGVRLSDPRDESLEYAILDLEPDGRLLLSVDLAFGETISPNIVDIAMERGDGVQKALIKILEGAS